MELRQLRYFVAVAEESNFGRAAERLLIAAPSLSQQIKVLERELRVQLFDRSASGARLTAAGRELLDPARAAIAAADEVRQAAERLAGGRSALLRLGFVPFALTGPAREVLAAFSLRYPAVEIEPRQYEWDDPSAGLLTGAVDIAVVRVPFRGEEKLRSVEIHREPVLAVMAQTHPLAGRTSVTVAELAEHRFLEAALVRDPVFAAFWYLRDLRSDPAIVSRSSTVEEWLAEIALGRGVNLIPASFAADYRRPGLTFLPVLGLPESRVMLAWDPDRPSEPAHALAQLAAREAARAQPPAGPAR